MRRLYLLPVLALLAAPPAAHAGDHWIATVTVTGTSSNVAVPSGVTLDIQCLAPFRYNEGTTNAVTVAASGTSGNLGILVDTTAFPIYRVALDATTKYLALMTDPSVSTTCYLFRYTPKA